MFSHKTLGLMVHRSAMVTELFQTLTSDSNEKGKAKTKIQSDALLSFLLLLLFIHCLFESFNFSESFTSKATKPSPDHFYLGA